MDFWSPVLPAVQSLVVTVRKNSIEVFPLGGVSTEGVASLGLRMSGQSLRSVVVTAILKSEDFYRGFRDCL